jgi:hypothetical protein
LNSKNILEYINKLLKITELNYVNQHIFIGNVINVENNKREKAKFNILKFNWNGHDHILFKMEYLTKEE